jgi:hypothetical protein
MSSKPYRRLVLLGLLVCISLGIFNKPAQAQSVPTQGQAIGILVVIVAIGAGIGIAIYALARKAPSITGCAASGPGGMIIEDENDHQVFTLTGDTADLKIGDRLRLIGKKKKKDPSGNRAFVVSKLKRNFGPCRVEAQRSTP